jgi:NNP family nitrate/nitrite transporter-like MFS transporter
MTVSIKRWEPENIIFWLTRGRRIANRNLLLSTLALHLNFNVWMMWSIVVSNLPAVGFAMTGQQQFLLVSIPPLVGAIMRLFYACIWSWVGGGTWLGISTLFLLIPALGVGWLVQDISAPFRCYCWWRPAAALAVRRLRPTCPTPAFSFPNRPRALPWG